MNHGEALVCDPIVIVAVDNLILAREARVVEADEARQYLLAQRPLTYALRLGDE
jgi:hypothetical protein